MACQQSLRTTPPTRRPKRASKNSTLESDRLQTKAQMDARTERRARAMLDEAASLAPAPTKADAEIDDQLSDKARVAWTQDGLLMPATKLAQEWQITRQALDRAADRNELVLLKINHR